MSEPAAEHRLQPLTRTAKLSDQVAAQLQALMAEQAFKPGEKLPSERELCKLLGVSRTVVREAVRALAARGFLDVRRGGGTLVRAPDSAIVSEMMSVVLRAGGGAVMFSQMQEVRRLLEVEIAGLAAERHTAEDLAEMQAQLDAMQANAADPVQWSAADVAFHAAIAAATHNPLYPILLGSIADLLIEVRLTGSRLSDTPERAYRYHSAIFEQIQARDRNGARAAMLDHLCESEETFRRAAKENQEPGTRN
jgi:GntR family transcriptional repressor for pyruvate dehydrogenase complex